MKAAICYEYGKPLVVEKVQLDSPQVGEVLVKLSATAICHSDIHLVRGEWGGKPPVIAGHEAAGVLERVGAGVENLSPGDRVVVSLLRTCGHCFYCTSGVPHLCEARFPLDTESRLHTQAGAPIRHGLMTAAFAEKAIVHHTQLVPIPDEMPLIPASLLACGVLTGVGAVLNTAEVRPGSSVAVVGLGGVGFSAIQGAVYAGAEKIIAIDLVEAKMESARAFGATHSLLAGDDSTLLKEVRTLTGGRGTDYVFVTVGSVPAVELGFRLARKQGTVVQVGIPAGGIRSSLPVGQHVLGEKRLLGSYMGSATLWKDVPRLVEMYLRGQIKLNELITARYALEDINEAIESTERGEAIRNVIVFDEGDRS